MARGIDYGGMMHRAMQRLIAEVLETVAEEGLPGEHHFFITFDTRDSDVEMADWLRERYPEEMTIVIQHWFENLSVTPEGFHITLNFGNSPEPLYIPSMRCAPSWTRRSSSGCASRTTRKTRTSPKRRRTSPRSRARTAPRAAPRWSVWTNGANDALLAHGIPRMPIANPRHRA